MIANDHILAVDDDSNNLLIIDELLADSFTVKTVTSGEEALRVAPVFQPNLILMDLMMPGLDGNETCRLLHAIPEMSRTKILMLSAKADITSRLASYDAGVVDYIAKPFDHAEVLAKVRAWTHMIDREELEEIWRDAETARDTVGDAMVLVAAFRDYDTGDHLLRMRAYSQQLAEQLSLSGPYTAQIDEAFLRRLYRASPLHDIGKVAIPDVILKKPGTLTEAEFAVVKQHTVIGDDMLTLAARQLPTADYMPMAAEIARSHHERFDGSGYPDGLSGTDIPLAARIVTVADVFDALTSKRTYKPSFKTSEAIEIIKKNAGTHFDPAVVDAFCRRTADFVRVRERYMAGPRASDHAER